MCNVEDVIIIFRLLLMCLCLLSSVSSNPVTQLESAPQGPACGDTDSARAGGCRSSRGACHGKAPVSQESALALQLNPAWRSVTAAACNARQC